MLRDKPTRAERLLVLLLSRKGKRVSLPEVQRVAGAQHGARLTEIRAWGYVVENVMEHVNGETHSWYVLRSEPGETYPLFSLRPADPMPEDVSRFEAERMRRRG